MYRVINQGKIVGRFRMFVDAWLEAIFLPRFSYIINGTDTWLVNPITTN